MSDQTSKTRAERREQEREARKDFDVVVKEIKRTLDERKDDEFKLAVIQALQHLEMQRHDNNLIAALMIGACVECQSRDDGAAARLLLYTSGAIVDAVLTKFTLNSIMLARQQAAAIEGATESPKLSAD